MGKRGELISSYSTSVEMDHLVLMGGRSHCNRTYGPVEQNFKSTYMMHDNTTVAFLCAFNRHSFTTALM